MGNIPWNGVYHADIGTPGNIADITQQLAETTQKVVPDFISEAARNAAAAPLIADVDFDDVGLMAYVQGQGLSVYDGTYWNYAGTTTPVVYTFGAGPSGEFSAGAGWPITTSTEWNVATWSFIPSRSGWAQVYIDIDAYVVATGWGNARFTLDYRDGPSGPWVAMDAGSSQVFLTESTATKWSRYPMYMPVYLTQGRQWALRMMVRTDGSGGAYRVQAVAYKVVQS